MSRLRVVEWMRGGEVGASEMNSGSDYCVFTHDPAEECLPYHVSVKEIIARPVSAHATNPLWVIPAKP
jgi:hypothetical protein